MFKHLKQFFIKHELSAPYTVNRRGRVCLGTSRLGTGKSLTFFYSVSFPYTLYLYYFSCRSLRKVMLKTCIGTDRRNGKEYKDLTHFTESQGVPGGVFKNGNGDIFHGRTGAELQDSLDDLLPEEIPGIPRHRPGEFSPRSVHHRIHCKKRLAIFPSSARHDVTNQTLIGSE